MAGLRPSERGALGIHSGPPTTGVEERLEALIIAQRDAAAAVRELAQALRPAPPAPTPGTIVLREPGDQLVEGLGPAQPGPRRRGRKEG